MVVELASVEVFGWNLYGCSGSEYEKVEDLLKGS